MKGERHTTAILASFHTLLRGEAQQTHRGPLCTSRRVTARPRGWLGRCHLGSPSQSRVLLYPLGRGGPRRANPVHPKTLTLSTCAKGMDMVAVTS